jgi:glycosyltransferase involved in cell wall biosynthesis
MKVAIVHDYLNQAGGAERVVAVLHRMFPDAPIFTTIFDKRAVRLPLAKADVRVSWMQGLPKWKRHFRRYMPLYPFAVRSFDLRGYDVVITSSSAFAKGVRVPPSALHLCYCYTPMRWAWSFDQYVDQSALSPSARVAARLTLPALRRWDSATSRNVDRFIAISTEVSNRIHATYGRASEIVFPPVDVARFRNDRAAGDYFLVVSRLNAYKRIDLAVRACTTLGLPLVVVGDGPEREALQALAGPTVRFTGRLTDREVTSRFERCRALILPGEEDFGLTPLEANAAGRPVVALARGGALDTVRDGETGVLFHDDTAESLEGALRAVQEKHWDAARLRAHAETFSEDVFAARFRAVLGSALEQKKLGRLGADDAA